MRAKRITTERIAAFVRFLQQEERSSGTSKIICGMCASLRLGCTEAV